MVINCLRLLVLVCALTSGLSAATVSWSGASNALWSNTGNWVGGVLPTSGDVASFAGQSVTIDTASAAAASIIGNAIITIPTGGTLTVSGTLAAGSITMTGGTLSGATVQCAVICTSTTGTLANVTIPAGISVDIGSTNAGAACNFSTVTIAGTVLVGSATNSNYGTLNFPGSQLITGGGSIQFGINTNGFNTINSTGGSGATLTVDTGFTINGKNGGINANQTSNTLVNNGTIACTVAGGLFTLTTTNWTNNKLISAVGGSNLVFNASTAGDNAAAGTISLGSGSVLTIDGTQTWTNPGLITGSGTIFDLGASFSSATGLTINGAGNTININGQVANGASILALSTFPWNLVGGTITGGTITGNPPNALICTSNTGTLTNVTIPVGSSLDIGSTNAGAVCNFNTVTIAGTVLVGSATNNSNYGTLNFPGSQLITGGGSIQFGINSNGFNSINSTGGSGFTLTVDTGFTINGKNGGINANQTTNTLVNNGTIACTVAGGLFTFTTTNWTNNKLISAVAGSNLTFTASATGDNAAAGSITLSTGSVLTINGTQTWTNAGAITGSGTIFDLGANFSSATGLTISGIGNTININGQVANGASTLALSTFPWNLVGGTITGGTITGNPPNALICTSNTGTLTNVTIPVGSSLDIGSTNAGAVCNFNTVTIAGTVLVGSATNNSNYGTLNFPGSQLITGGGSIQFGINSNGFNSINSTGGSGLTLTVDTGFTINGKNGGINANQTTNTLVNNGTIACTVAGGLFTFTTTNWTNNKLISAVAGSNLTFTASATGDNAAAGSITLSTGSVLTINGTQTWTNPGLITGSGTIFDLGANFSSATGLTISGIGNTININGQVANGASTLALSTFPWNLVGGTITGGSITGNPPNALICTSNTGTLTNVTIPVGSSLDIGSTNAGAVCNFNTVTIAGTVLVGSATNNSNYGTLYFPGSQLITGGGTILFGGNVNGYNTINSSGGSGITLTVDTGFTIHGKNGVINANQATNTLVNNGTIACTVAGGLFTFTTTNWTNNKLISAVAGSNLTFTASATGDNAAAGSITLSTGSVLTINGTQTWTNPGLITGSGTIFDLGAKFSSATGLTISGIGNTININGQVANGASTLALSTFPWNLVGGTITGGTITGNPPNALICTGNTGTLSNVTIPVGSSLDIGSTNAGAVCNLNTVTIAGTVLVGSATNNSNYGTLNFPGSQLITGGGSIQFGINSNGFNSINSTGGSGFTLTVDTGFTINGKNGGINANQTTNTLVNNGTIACTVAGGLFTFTTTSWTNNHQISAIAGSNLTVSASTTGTNATGGTIALSTGSVLTVNGTQTWSNAGAITGSGTIFDLGASFSSATGLTIDGSGNTININGQVANGASTIALSTFPWNLVGGTITGGTITGTPPNALICTGNTGTLSNVTIPSGSSLDIGSTNSGAACNLSNVTIAGTVMVGSTSSANYGTLYFPGSQLITGGGTIQFGINSNGFNSINSSGGSGITLTVDIGFTIHGKNGVINANQATNTLVNNGTIACDVSGGAFAFNTTHFTNNATLTVSQGVADTWTMAGAFAQGPSGILNLEIGGTGSYDKLTINGTANLGGTLNLTTIDGYYLHQGDAFTLISTSAGGLSGNFTAVTGSFSLAYNTASLVATAQDTTTPTVTVSPALAFSPGSPLAFTITFSEPVTGLTMAGLTVTNGTVSNLSGSSTTYGATILPNALGGSTNEVVTVTVKANQAANSGGHQNAAASNTASTTYEIPPTVQVSPGNGAVVGAPPTFTLTFSNPVQGLTTSGMTISGATISSISPPLPTTLTSSYTVTTTMPGQGAVQFTLKAGVVVDQAGNLNPATVPETVTYGSTVTWIGPASGGDWNTGANWNTSSVPGAGSDVVIPAGNSIVLTEVATANLHTLNLAGTITIGAGSMLQVATQLTANDNIITLAGGTLTLAGGILQGAIVQNGGGGSLIATSGNVDAITIAAGTALDLSTVNGASCLVTDGITDNGSILMATGTNAATLSWSGSQAWTGSGTIALSSGANTIHHANSSAETLTTGLTIHGLLGTFDDAGTSAALINNGTIASDAGAGTFSFEVFSLTNAGSMVIGLDTAQGWTCTGDFIQTVGSLTMAVGGIAEEQSSLLIVDQAATLSGGITLVPINGYQPDAPDAITILTSATASSGTFSPVSGLFTLDYSNPLAVVADAIDTSPPTVAVSAPASPTKANPLTFTLTFSQPVTLVNSLVISGGTGSPTGGPTTFTVLVTPTGQGPISVTVPVGAAQSIADSVLNTASGSASATFDSVPPTVVSITPNAISTNASPIIFVVTFSEPVATLVANSTNGTPLQPTGGPTVWTLPVLPAGNGPVSLTVPAGGATDLAGNPTTAAASATVTFASASPSVTVTPTGTATNQSPITFTLTFSEAVTGLTTGGITVTNGSLGALTAVSGTTYTIPVTPTLNGAVTLQVNAGAASDLAANPSLASNPASVTFDTVLPTVAISPSGTITNVSPITFTLTFSEPVVGLSASGLVAGNGTLGVLTGGPSVYTIPVTPTTTNGQVTLSAPAGAASDLAGNPSVASALATVTYDNQLPTVVVTPTGTATNQSPITFTLTFSTPVSGLSAAGLTVGNGTLGVISGGPAVYSIPVNPSANGPVTLMVDAGAAHDAAANPNAASSIASMVYDTVPPGIALAISSPLPLTAASTTLTIAFSEPVTGFSAGSIAVSNAALSGFAAVTASTYTAILNPTAPATASVQIAIPAGAASDLAGNPSLAAVLILSQQTAVGSTTVATPVVATSPGGGTVYGALCPGTWNGLAQVQAFLSGKSDAQARGFVWDALAQNFVQVPAQAPSGGWQPFQGVFLATRQPASFDFNGSMATLDYELVLKPGWNFVGLPPLDDNGVELVSHAWVDLRLEDTSGNLLSGAQRSGLIDVGPWLWDGTSYSQVAVMQTGSGYWIENASSPGVDLVLRRLSSAEIAGTAPILGAAHGAGLGSGTAAATIGYHAHGSPPMPPGSGSSQHESSAHGCGLGSGIGALLGFAAFLLLRLRSRGRI